jgi:hypothetical protein
VRIEQESVRPSGKTAPDYNQIFRTPHLPAEPVLVPPHAESNWFFRRRNSLWWVVVFLVISASALAFMKSDFGVADEAESGCGDS